MNPQYVIYPYSASDRSFGLVGAVVSSLVARDVHPLESDRGNSQSKESCQASEGRLFGALKDRDCCHYAVLSCGSDVLYLYTGGSRYFPTMPVLWGSSSLQGQEPQLRCPPTAPSYPSNDLFVGIRDLDTILHPS